MSIAAEVTPHIEESDTILDISNTAKNTITGMMNVYRYSWVTKIANPNRYPYALATALPPLNPANTGKQCPKHTASPIYCSIPGFT